MSFVQPAVILAVGAWIAACTTGKAGPDGGADATMAQQPGTCGVVLFSDPMCQIWLDTNCCDFEKRCDASCKAIIACVSNCPAPKTDECLGTCSGNFDNSALDELSNCSKSVAPPTGRTCVWP